MRSALVSSSPSRHQHQHRFLAKEGVLSSQIEGTQSTLSDFLRFETEAQSGQPADDTGRKRGRVFSYQRYLAILGEGTDPLPLNS